MDQTDISELEQSVARLSFYYTDAGELLTAIRKEHPKASKKDIVLAALSAMIGLAEHDPAAAKRLHSLAMDNRGANQGG
ncbi:MAG: hypothetical protein GX458_03670 [Phyllobacteriaceae bacterium]|nr:hypothetical protein [Phyllobacteriaceae bacterium]